VWSRVARPAALSLLLACADENPFVSNPDDWALQPIQVRSTTLLGARLIEDSSDVSSWFVQLMAVNMEATPDTIGYGACSFGAVLYDAPARTHPVWDNAPRAGTPCIEIAYYLVVPAAGGPGLPGIAGATVSHIGPGTPLPAGTYWAGLAYRIGEQTLVAPADTITLPSRAP
jgi:hypothetical protein